MATDWSERLAGARMQVDGQFNDRILDSQFTNQEWGLIMTAVEFEIENPADPEQARLVANTDNVPAVLGELGGEQGPVPHGPADGSGDSSGGFLSRLGEIMGIGGSESDDEETLAAAEELADAYATQLQEFLEENGQWNDVCADANRSQQS